ncbi:hypothetical protein V8C86DRAFT_2439210 [Haematococcus lacustris]
MESERDFDDQQVDDEYLLDVLGFTKEETWSEPMVYASKCDLLEDQRAWADASYTDPEAITPGSLEQMAELHPDLPDDLKMSIADKMVYGPPVRSPALSAQAIILAGFPLGEPGMVRQMLDAVGAAAIKVLPISGSEALHESVDAVLWAPEQDWAAPRHVADLRGEADPLGGGGWGSQRAVLFSGISIKVQATILELLDGLGVGEVAATMALEEDSHRPLGQVLAEAIKVGVRRGCQASGPQAMPGGGGAAGGRGGRRPGLWPGLEHLGDAKGRMVGSEAELEEELQLIQQQLEEKAKERLQPAAAHPDSSAHAGPAPPGAAALGVLKSRGVLLPPPQGKNVKFVDLNKLPEGHRSRVAHEVAQRQQQLRQQDAEEAAGGADPDQERAQGAGAVEGGGLQGQQVAAEVGIRLPDRSMVSAAKARIESELKQQPVQPLSRPRRDQGGVQGAGARMGDAGTISRGEVNEDQANPLPKGQAVRGLGGRRRVQAVAASTRNSGPVRSGPVTSSGRPRDPGVDIEEDGVDPDEWQGSAEEEEAAAEEREMHRRQLDAVPASRRTVEVDANMVVPTRKPRPSAAPSPTVSASAQRVRVPRQTKMEVAPWPPGAGSRNPRSGAPTAAAPADAPLRPLRPVTIETGKKSRAWGSGWARATSDVAHSAADMNVQVADAGPDVDTLLLADGHQFLSNAASTPVSHHSQETKVNELKEESGSGDGVTATGVRTMTRRELESVALRQGKDVQELLDNARARGIHIPDL